jgi:hypothetical protein
MLESKGAYHFATGSIEFDSANELWNTWLSCVDALLGTIPAQADNQLIACTWPPFGDHDSQIAITLRTGALEYLATAY